MKSSSNWFLAALCLGTTLGLPAAAQENSPQIWINGGFFSYHLKRDNSYRERNWGIGAEAIVARDHVALAGTYLNSENFRSHYAGYEWRPLHWQPYGLQLSAGVAVTAVDGYPTTNNGGWFVAPIPTLAIEGRRFGVNLVFVPNFKQGPALAAQLKLRVW